MTFSDVAWRYGLTVRVGIAGFVAETPPRVWLTTTLPRAVLQCLFLTLLGKVSGGTDGLRFAFIGSVAAVMMLSTLVGVCDVPMLEKWEGTFYRLQAGVLQPGTTFFLRTVPWVGEAIVSAVVSIAVVGVLVGQAALAVRLLLLTPVFVLMALTSAAAGAAAASVAVGRRADVLVGNAFAYLVLAAGGVLIPAGRAPVLDTIGSVLPIRHGVLAIRATLDGRPWAGELTAEILRGAGWAVIAWLAYRLQSRRARKLGIDDYD